MEKTIKPRVVIDLDTGIQTKIVLKQQSMEEKMLGALKKFCRRVEAGEVRSKKTYQEFKDLIQEYEDRK